MSSRRVEGFGRTTKRLLEQERAYQRCKVFLLEQSPTRRAELAAYLLTRLGVEFDGDDIGKQATLLAYQTLELQNAILQRAITGGASRTGLQPGEQSPVTETPAAAPVPPTVPSAVSKP